jgi:TetR/AcrR family transcriptional repressor of nem operon
MDTKPSRKQVTHDRILEVAARAIRRAGYDGVGVADIMKEAGLTHGGFYAHFPSRDAMLAQALERAGRDGAAQMGQRMAARRARGASAFRALVEAYLSDAHLTASELGCPVAALSSEMARQPPEVRQASCDRVRGLLEMAQQALPDGTSAETAMVVASTLLGALQLARTLGDNAQGKAMLAASRKALLAQYDS